MTHVYGLLYLLLNPLVFKFLFFLGSEKSYLEKMREENRQQNTIISLLELVNQLNPLCW